MFLGACFAYAMGCSSSSSTGTPSDGGSTTAAGTTGTTGTLVTGATGTAGGGSGVTTSGTTVGSGGAGGATTTGSGGSGGGVVGANKLGAACGADADCGTGLTCSRPTDNFSAVDPGGVGNGLCTLDCTASQAACAPFGAVCVAIDVSDAGAVTKAVCLENCKVGAPPVPPAAPKCHGREDVACESVNQAGTVFSCIPLCATNADCGTRKCDLASGFCVDTPMTGKPIGASCTFTSGMASTECAGGLCVPIVGVPDGGTTAQGFCTAFCRLGSVEACNFRISALDAGAPVGACLEPLRANYDVGDLGFCLQLCDSSADCGFRSADWLCRTDQMVQGTGHAVCLPPDPG